MLTKEDLAKYPSIEPAREYVKQINIDIATLADEYPAVVDRARQILGDIIVRGVYTYISSDFETEILAFAVVRLFIDAIGDEWLRRRFAVAFSKRVGQFLQREENEKILEIAKMPGNVSEHGWNLIYEIRRVGVKFYEWKLHFKDYLSTAIRFHDITWKMCNHPVSNGYVRLTKRELARLLAEAFKERVLEKRIPKRFIELPDKLMKILEDIEELIKRYKKEVVKEIPIKAEITGGVYPPCIQYILERTERGENLSHVERLFLMFFMLDIGKAEEEVVNLFRKMPDFNEERTKYYVKHAKSKGYTAHNCDTLKTYGICRPTHKWCSEGIIKNPLVFYGRMVYILGKERRTQNEK